LFSDFRINGRFLTQSLTGVQRYAREIVTAIDGQLAGAGTIARHGPTVVAPKDARIEMAMASLDFRRFGIGSGHFWEQTALSRCGGIGLLCLGNTGPLLGPPKIICIHDTNVWDSPESYSLAFRKTYQMLLPALARSAWQVTTVSRYSAERLVHLGIVRNKTPVVIPNGHEHVFRWSAARSTLGERIGRTDQFLLMVGSGGRHKNIGLILSLASEIAALGLKLVVAGNVSDPQPGQAEAEPSSNVVFLGRVTDDDLCWLYAHAIALLFPSLQEGFGVPALEAMALGCPVIASTAASLPEIGGSAVLYASPDDPREWMGAIRTIASDRALAERLSSAGRDRAKDFTWTVSAAKYLALMARLAEATADKAAG